MTKSIAPKNLIIYVDDDPDDLILVEQSFRQYSNNVEVITFMDGTHAFNYLKSLPEFDPVPCLIILDINMPGLNGKGILIKLRDLSRFKSVPIVLFSTSSLPSDKEFAILHSAGFVTKPLDINQMEAITDQFIDQCTEEIRKKIRKQIQ
jgi:CheY-like chemotaxis protein